MSNILDKIIHIVPAAEWDGHAVSWECPCEPSIELAARGTLIVHNPFVKEEQEGYVIYSPRSSDQHPKK